MEFLEIDPDDSNVRKAFARRMLAEIENRAKEDFALPPAPGEWAAALDRGIAEAREGRFTAGFDADLLVALFFRAEEPVDGLDEAGRDLLRERALLALWYFFSQELEEKELTILGTWIERLCTGAEDEPSEIVRGRMLWLRINLLDKRGADDDIEGIIRGLREGESSPYVWERIAAFLSGWDGTWRLYREMHSWPELAERKDFAGLPGIHTRQARLFAARLDLVEGYRSQLPAFVQAAIQGELQTSALDWIFDRYAEGGFGFPLQMDIFSQHYKASEGTARRILLGWVERYSTRAPEGTLDGGFLHIIAESGACGSDRLSRVAASLAEAELHRRSGDYVHAYRALLGTAIEAERDQNGGISPSAAQDLHQKIIPRALRLIVEGSITDPAMDLLGQFLASASGLIQAIAVDILLFFAKADRDVSEAMPALRKILSASPNTTGFMSTKGGDLGEYTLAPFFFVPHIGSFTETPSSEEKGDGGFMSLDKLTGLVEVVTRPDTAWRAAKLLRAIAEKTDDKELLAFLADFRGVNSVLADLDAANLSTMYESKGIMLNVVPIGSVGDAKATKEHRVVPLKHSYILGPLKVPEIAAALEAFSSSTTGTIPSRTKALQRSLSLSIAERYQKQVEEARRNAIVGVFGSGLEDSPSLFASIHADLSAAGGIAQLEHECVRGPDEWTPDLLAFYQTRAFLAHGERHFFGVYFCARNILECAEASGSDVASLVRVVAVHEWFHALMEQILGNKYDAHSAAHGNTGFCRLEEAAANAVARGYLTQVVPENVRKNIDTVLFEKPAARKRPGYGEWGLMGTDVPAFVPHIVLSVNHVEPPGYGLERTTSAFSIDAFSRSLSMGLWKSLLAGLEDETIPCWLDLRGLIE